MPFFHEEGSHMQSRENFIRATRTNISQTGLTFWYGAIGASVSVGCPIIGTMSPPLALVSALIPMLSRWGQTADIISNNDLHEGRRWHYYAQATTKALVNLLLLAATYQVGMLLGQAACFLFLVSFCVSKLINLGNDSPIEHIEDMFSTAQKERAPNRQSFIQSLGANVHETIRATYYGLIAAATQFPFPLIGQLTESTAVVLFISPLVGRITQTNAIAEEDGLDNPNNAGYFRGKALVSTTMDILVGLGLFTAATLLQLDKLTLLVVLAGWASAKLTSGGANSPLMHIQNGFDGFFSGQRKEAVHAQIAVAVSTI